MVLVVLVVVIGVFVQRRRRTGGMIADVHRGRAIHPDNRVTVASETDPYGMPVAHFDYSRSENDKANIAYSTDVIKSILHAAGAQDILSIQRYPPLVGGARMGRGPETSGVNSDRRVWEVPNLFVSERIVFPTGDSATPALTTMVLTSRLAERLGSRSTT